jgi:hypothetical protein
MPNNHRKDNYCGFYTRSFSVPSTVEEKDRSVTAVVSTEQPVLVFDHERWEPVMEILLADGAEFPKNGRVPLLDCHQRYSIKDQLGSADGFKRVGDGIEARTVFSSTEQDAFTKVKEGHLRDLSVGYQTYAASSVVLSAKGDKTTINEREFINDSDQYPLVIRKKWKIREVSVTPIGADDKAKFRKEEITPNTLERSEPMPDTIATPVQPTPEPVRQPVDVDAIRKAAIIDAQNAERSRVTEITDCARELGIDAKDVDDYVKKGTPAAEAIRAMIAKAKESLKPVDASVTVDENEKKRDLFIAGLEHRALAHKDPKVESDLAKAGMRGGISLQGLARRCLEMRGVKNLGNMDSIQVAAEILKNSGRVFSQMTDDFPYILAAVTQKFMLRGWEEAPTTYQLWTASRSLSNFNSASIVGMSNFSDILKVPEGAAPKMGKFSDKGETAQLATWGRAFSISRQAIINDDMSAFSVIPQRMIAAVRRQINYDVYLGAYGLKGSGVVGPTMTEDSTAAFDSAAHGNLGTTGAISETTIAEAMKLLMMTKLMAPEGSSITQYANLSPSFMLVHPAKVATARKILYSQGSTTSGENASVINPVVGTGIQIITDANIAGISDYVWYMGASPAIAPNVTVYTLTGYETPQLSQREGEAAEAKGYIYDVMFDYVVGWQDWRGIVKNIGA